MEPFRDVWAPEKVALLTMHMLKSFPSQGIHSTLPMFGGQWLPPTDGYISEGQGGA